MIFIFGLELPIPGLYYWSVTAQRRRAIGEVVPSPVLRFVFQSAELLFGRKMSEKRRPLVFFFFLRTILPRAPGKPSAGTEVTALSSGPTAASRVLHGDDGRRIIDLFPPSLTVVRKRRRKSRELVTRVSAAGENAIRAVGKTLRK